MEKIIIAHRGASGSAKENTLEAFQKAVELGADMIEFDVRKTKDGKLIIIHDAKIGSQKISDLYLEGINAIAQSEGYKIPELEEALQFLRGKIKLDIELKETGYEEEVVDLILRYFSEKDFIIISFNEDSVLYVKSKYPHVKTGLILGKKSPKKLIQSRLKEAFPFLRAKKLKADYLVISWKLAALPFFIRTSQYFGLPVIIWTVNDRKKIHKFLKRKNVSGVTTDYPIR